jgi:hypothetical protein
MREKPLKRKSQKVLCIVGVIFDSFASQKRKGDTAIGFKFYVAHL